MTSGSKFTRREFVKRTAVAGTVLAVSTRFGLRPAYAVAANSGNLRKWIQPLRNLTALGDAGGIPVAAGIADPVFPNTVLYQITAGEFSDQLHPDLPNPTKLWGYWDSSVPNPIQRHLGGVIISPRGVAARIRMTNALPDRHVVPVDPTVMLGPGSLAHNRIAIHLHGGFVPWICDGGPFDWWDPTGAKGESFQNGPGSLFDNLSPAMTPAQADYYYPNDQSTRLMWYHDHAWGITRINAYAGLASGYLILDAINNAYVVAGKIPGLVDGDGKAQTFPLVFQDKVFVSATTALTSPTWASVARSDAQAPGHLYYEHVYDPRQFKLLKGGAYLPPPNPSIIPEFYGDTMLANGTAYPLLTVEAKRYRFLVLNACNARFLNLNLFQANPKNVDGIDLDPRLLFPLNPPGPNMIQIGTEAGFLVKETVFVSPKPVNPATMTGNLLLGPAERADIVIDFTGQAGKEFILYNDAPSPFPGGAPTNDYYLGNPNNPIQPITIREKATGTKWSTGPDTRQLLRIKVVAGASDPQPADILVPGLLDPGSLLDYPNPLVGPLRPLNEKPGVTVTRVWDVTLNEDFDAYGRLRQRLGTTLPNPAGGGFGRDLLEDPTETPAAGSVEIWRIFNATADTHPIHFHLVNVQVMSRQPFVISKGLFSPTGVARGPELNEIGWKETVQCHPGEVTSVIMKFDLPAAPFPVEGSERTKGNEYVWHCHILEHEEHDMMRPLVTSAAPLAVTTVQEVSSAAGGTATFFVSRNVGADDPGDQSFTVAPAAGAPGATLPEEPNGSFTVAVAAGTPTGIYEYTVSDGSATAIAQLRVV